MVMEFGNGAVGHLIYHSATWSAELPGEGLFSWAPGWYELVRGAGGGHPDAVWQDQPGNIRVHGTKGALRIYHYANHLFLRTSAGVEEIRVADRPMPGQFAAEMASFARSVLRGDEPEVTGADGRAALRAALAVYQSMETRQWVSLAPRDATVPAGRSSS